MTAALRALDRHIRASAIMRVIAYACSQTPDNDPVEKLRTFAAEYYSVVKAAEAMHHTTVTTLADAAGDLSHLGELTRWYCTCVIGLVHPPSSASDPSVSSLTCRILVTDALVVLPACRPCVRLALAVRA